MEASWCVAGAFSRAQKSGDTDGGECVFVLLLIFVSVLLSCFLQSVLEVAKLR